MTGVVVVVLVALVLVGWWRRRRLRGRALRATVSSATALDALGRLMDDAPRYPRSPGRRGRWGR